MASVRMQLALCGPIASVGEIAKGGYQACNRRTIAALTDAGFAPYELPYPQPKAGGLNKLLGYVSGFPKLFQSIRHLRPSVFHLTGLYKQFVYVEYMMLLCAKARGCQVIYDVRAGSMQYHYRSRGPLYRWCFRRVIRFADVVMIEGREYSSFVERVSGKTAIYLPNHVDFSIWGHMNRQQDDSFPTLIYLGRLVPEKGIETVLKASACLEGGGLSHRMLVAGWGEENYVNMLKCRFDSPSIEWLGPIGSESAVDILKRSHFFLFPTRHTGEGHSNSLTEAMAAGCVPIASLNGFNASVVGDSGWLLGRDAGPQEYADIVSLAWQSGNWSNRSSACSLRVRDMFSTEAVVRNLVVDYEQCWSRICPG